MSEQIQLNDENYDALKKQTLGFVEYYRKCYSNNRLIHRILVVLGIFLGFSVTVAGLMDQGRLAAILGLVITLFIALQSAFNFEEKYYFYRILHVEAKSLRDRLQYMEKTNRAEFNIIFNSCQKLRRRSANGVP
ncbi:MAG: DUF4231 domain-containing protein [Nostoc sp. ChiSLP01]|nr:DUF4231 domain-containing protein [Nostoc sp. CmiSLP01]MDZ8286051.1 DUF4231 domain-containing protein [Nostoc sp. ChiSLP01]